MWATNVSGTFHVTRAATRHLLRAAAEAGAPRLPRFATAVLDHAAFC